MMDSHTLDSEAHLGTCCACLGRKRVRTFVMLSVKSPTPGQGWGCLECGLPMDGAVAVLCDACVPLYHEDKSVMRFACSGYPEAGGRVPIDELEGEHLHDMSKHEPA